jgi:lysozyme
VKRAIIIIAALLLMFVFDTYSMTTSENGKSFIVKFEGMHRQLESGSYTPYKCPAGVWTVGPGLTGRSIKNGQIYTAYVIDRMYSKRLTRYERYIFKRFPGRLWNQNQFDALVSFVWNLGSIRSGFYKALKSGNYRLAMHKMQLYTKAGGRHLRGLARRRTAEVKLFNKPVIESYGLGIRNYGLNSWTLRQPDRG